MMLWTGETEHGDRVYESPIARRRRAWHFVIHVLELVTFGAIIVGLWIGLS